LRDKNLRQILELVESGQEVVILRRGKEVAKIVPVARKKSRKTLPSLKDWGRGTGSGTRRPRPQADGRLQGKTSLSPAQENLIEVLRKLGVAFLST
jgi:prevent-host-death family protein